MLILILFFSLFSFFLSFFYLCLGLPIPKIRPSHPVPSFPFDMGEEIKENSPVPSYGNSPTIHIYSKSKKKPRKGGEKSENHHIAFVPIVATDERKVPAARRKSGVGIGIEIDIRETPVWNSGLLPDGVSGECRFTPLLAGRGWGSHHCRRRVRSVRSKCLGQRSGPVSGWSCCPHRLG
jgi:hypothetical protein